MKKSFKKTLCVMLSVICILCTLSVGFTAVAQQTKNLPIVFVEGRGYFLYADKTDPTSERIYPYSTPDGYIAEKASELLPIFAKAYITKDYTEYCDFAYDAVSPIFEKLLLNDDGEATNGSGILWDYTAPLTNTAPNGNYGLYDYSFHYDWRLDPCETADQLAFYIDSVLEATGKSKVGLVGRCLGANICMAYLAEYGAQKVDTTVFYVGTNEGIAECGSTFSGDIALHPDATVRYAYDMLGDGYLNDLLKSTVTLFNKTYGLDLAASFIDSVYVDIADTLVPRLVLSTFATMPSYWSLVGKAYYTTARENIFGSDPERFAGILEKIDYYHENVLCKNSETLMKCKEQGMNVSVICKYGWQVVPITAESDKPGDDLVELDSSSFGATCTKPDETFDKAYLDNAEKNGTLKYIAPDLQVDASTCLFPDNTWFIKNMKHENFAPCVDRLIVTCLKSPTEMTVNDNENYPQFMVYNEESSSLEKMTDDNHVIDRWENPSFFRALANFIKALFAYIEYYFSTVKAAKA